MMHEMTTRMAAFAAVALLAATAFAATSAGDGPDARLLAKAGPELRELLAGDKTGGFEAIVTGAPHEGVTAAGFPDRAQAMRELETRAAPLLDGVAELVRAHGGELVNAWPAAPAVKVRGDLALLEALAQREDVIHVEADRPDAVQLIEPLAPGADGEVGVLNTQGRQMIQAEELWGLGYRGAGIKVSVIDTGIDATHEAFKNADGSTRVAKFANCVDATCDDTAPPIDDHGHGTHVAGTVLGTNLYNDPVWGKYQEVGVAPEATLYVAKFLSAGGGGSWEAGLASVQWSFDAGADLTSNSWGGNCQGSLAIIQLTRQLAGLGMASVYAAGNSGTFAFLGPACGEYAISVGAVTGSYTIAGFSSRGPCSDPDTGSGPRICPDVVAKGVAVRSAIPRSGAGWADASGYRVWEGTSMATPHVAGALAIAEQMKRDLTGSGWDTANREDKEILKATALDLGAGGPDNTFGWGHVQLLGVQQALDASEDAVVVDFLGVTHNNVREGRSTNLHYGVRNLGSALATGTFTAELRDPHGNLVAGTGSTESLGLLDDQRFEHTFTADQSSMIGDYTFQGRFQYTWTDSDGNPHSGVVERSGTFRVLRVILDVQVDGLPSSAGLVFPQDVEYTVRNIGNDFSPTTELRFLVPAAYEFVPGENFDPQETRTRYAEPTPDGVQEANPAASDTTLRWDAGELWPGDSFAFTTSLLPYQLGEQVFETRIAYQNGAGDPLTFVQEHVQEVTPV